MEYSQQGTVDVNGNLELTFIAPGIGKTITGTLTVVGSPNGVVWTVNRDEVPVTTTVGSSPIAGIQARDDEQISVTGSNLNPGTMISATWSALLTDSATTIYVAPEPPAQQVIQSGAARVAVPSFTTTIGAGLSKTFQVQLQPNERSLVFLGEVAGGGVGGNNLTVTVTGNQTGTGYIVNEDWGVLAGTSLSLPPLTAPAYGIADTSVTVTLTNNTGGALQISIIEVLALPDEVLQGSINNPIFVENQSAAPLFTEPAGPGSPTATILDGNELGVTASGGPVTMISIPAGKTWVGTVTIQCTSLTIGGAGANQANKATCLISLTNGGTPGTGNLLQCTAASSSATAAAQNPAGEASITVPLTIIAGGVAARLLFTATITAQAQHVAEINAMAVGSYA